MFACCQRRDPKAFTDYNLIESPRDQSRPLPLDLYTETASDDRKSFLSKTHALRTHCTHSRAHRKHEFFPSFFTSFSLFLALLRCCISLSTASPPTCTRMCTKHVPQISFHSSFFYPQEAYTLLKYLPYIVLNPFSSPLIAQFFLLSGIFLSCVFLYFSNPIFSRMRLRPTHAPPSCAFLCMFGRRLVSRYRSGMFLPNIRLVPSLTVVYIGLHLSLSFSFFSLYFFLSSLSFSLSLCFSSRYKNGPVKIAETHIEEHSSTTNEKVYTNKKS